MKMRGAEIAIKALESHGIEIVSGIPGGANLALYDALSKSKIRHILARHEQGAAFIAHGIARSTGKTAVCFATSGPGATNLVTAIADAQKDSVPLIAITGQVARSLIGTEAFQEVDLYSICKSITKSTIRVNHASEISKTISDAFAIVESGRQGPVVIDIPKDIFTEEAEYIELKQCKKESGSVIDNNLILRAADAINKAKRPLIYAGGGVIASGSASILSELACKNTLPVALTLTGLGAFSPESPLSLGMLGMHGSRATNIIVDKADLIIALGARFNDRTTGKMDSFARNAKIIHVDIDPRELGKRCTPDIAIKGNVYDFIAQIIQYIDSNKRPNWQREINSYRAQHKKIQTDRNNDPEKIIRKIRTAIPKDAIITTDVGQHQMWMAQYFDIYTPRSFLTSAGLGTMGFGLPAAIGAALANPGKKVFCVTGDGSLMMNIQELATLAELDLDITIIVMNNGHLGLVRQQQELFFEKNFFACQFKRPHDFTAIAAGFGIAGINVNEEISAYQNIFERKGPFIIDLKIAENRNVLPIVPAGASNTEAIFEHYDRNVIQIKKSRNVFKPVPDKTGRSI